MTGTHTEPCSKCKEQPQLLTTSARVVSAALTPLGHLSCELETSTGRLKAISDAASVHLLELRVGAQMQVVLLRLRRATADAVWHWQLLCCRTERPSVDFTLTAGSQQ